MTVECLMEAAHLVERWSAELLRDGKRERGLAYREVALMLTRESLLRSKLLGRGGAEATK